MRGAKAGVFFILLELFFMVPLGSTAVSHLRTRFAYILGNLRACAEPRRASAHRGEARLVYTTTDHIFTPLLVER